MSIVIYENETSTSPKTIHGDNCQIKSLTVNCPRADAIGNNLSIAWFSMNDKKVEVKGWHDKTKAAEIIEAAINRFKEKFPLV